MAEKEDQVITNDIQKILNKFDCYNRGNSGPSLKFKEDAFEEDPNELSKWHFEENSDVSNSNEITNVIDIDKYWNFYGTVSPKIDVEFLVGYEKDSSNKIKKDENGKPIKNWVNINYNNFTKNSNYNSYFVSANIIDNGIKELELVLYDRTFTNIQRLISASINFVDSNLNNNDSEVSDSDIFKATIKNGADLNFFTSPSKISSNIRIRYGYNENKNLTVTDDYKGFGDDKTNKSRWRTAETSKVTEEGVSVNDEAIKEQFHVATLFSTWDEFYITGLTSTLTETGIKYTIKGVSVDEFSLNGYKMYQQYSVIKGKPKTVMASLMNMFNKDEKSPIKLVWVDDTISSTDSAINGSAVLMDYKSGKYINVDEEVANKEMENIKRPINDISKNINMLTDILACFSNVQNNKLDSYSNGQSVAYNSNIGIILKSGFSSYANIPDKKSFLDLVSWPFNISSDLEPLNISGSYKTSIKKIASFQKTLSNNYGEIIKILKNKESGWDTKSSISSKDIVKIWLANIATEAYGIKGGSSGKIGSLANALENEKKYKDNYDILLSKIKDAYNEYNRLPINWSYIPIENEILEYSINYYYPGRSYVSSGLENNILNLNGISGKISYDLLTKDNILNSFYEYTPRTVDEMSNKEINLYNLYKHLSIEYYKLINFITNPDKPFDDIFKFGGKSINLKTNFFSEQADVDSVYSLAYQKEKAYIPNVKKDLFGFQDGCEKLINKFEKINDDLKTNLYMLVGNVKNNEIYFYSTDKENPEIKTPEKIFSKIGGKTTVNGFNVNNMIVNFLGLDDDKKKYNIAITDKPVIDKKHIYGKYFYLTVDSCLQTSEIEKKLKKIIKDILQVTINTANKEAIILDVDLFNMHMLESKEEEADKKILEEYKIALQTIKENILLVRGKNGEVGKFDEALKNKIDSKNAVKGAKNNISSNNSYLKQLFEEEIESINENENSLIELYYGSEDNEKKPFGSHDGYGSNNNYNFNPDIFTPGNFKNNFLIDAFNLMDNDNFGLEEAEKFSNCIKEEIEKLKKKLKVFTDKQNKIDASNIGKEIELSLGSQESRNKDLKLTKTLSSLLNDFCSQCQPKVKNTEIDIKNNGNITLRDGNGDSKKVNAYEDFPKYNLTWGIVGHYQALNKEQVPIVGLYYKEPKPTKILRMYNWGTGNPKAHCVKSLSIANSSEFAMMHNFSTITKNATGISSVINSDGGKLEINDFMPNKSPCFFSGSFDSNRDEILFNNTINSIAKGTITLLGDPSLKFSGSIQPYTYPIYVNIKLQNENRYWSDNISNEANESQVSQLSGYYIITKISHNISASGYTTTLEVMKYPNSGNDIVFGDGNINASYLNSASITNI